MPAILFFLVAAAASAEELSFAVRHPGGAPLDGRLLLLISKDPTNEPRFQILPGPNSQLAFGIDVDGWKPGEDAIFDAAVPGYPVDSLREMLVTNYHQQFGRIVTEKLLTYALGRGFEYGDMPLVRSIVKDAQRANYRFSSIILGIVNSPAFQMNMKTADPSEQRAAR